MPKPWLLLLLMIGCNNATSTNPSFDKTNKIPLDLVSKKFEEGSWPSFLQNLRVVDSPVIDYRGKKIHQQWKSAGIIPYDVGKADLQQCADALMRLRAEYLFEKKRFDEIGFHFVSGDYFSFEQFCKGLKPVVAGNGVRFITGSPSEKTHAALRKYLDLVYTYASTISLAKELKKADRIEVGTVVVYAGSPGHCFIVIDEAVDEEGQKVFRLAEGYTPAQSIYVLRNTDKEGKSPWHRLGTGTIRTPVIHLPIMS